MGMEKCNFEAAIFDLDGVITQTEILHLESWKLVFDEYLKLREERDKEPFREFTHQDDYLPYVDGKPRYQGVKSFLESRGINIPFGDPSDSPEKETICGIGNRKNQKFLQLLQEREIKVYPGSLKLIEELKKRGVKLGVASSSQNCQQIMKSAGIEKFFQTRVDGLLSEELGLKGKPEPDIFLAALKNLGVHPARAVVIEDASSGVEAGRNAGFGLVLGIARKDNQQELFASGADLVVEDLSELDVSCLESWFRKKPNPLSQYWEEIPQYPDLVLEGGKIEVNPVYFRKAKNIFLGERKLLFFLDYDGTLTPIVERPELAILSKEMREVLRELSARYRVAIVSGRAREDVEKLVGIEGVFYAGSHGFDIRGPGFSMLQPEAERFVPLILQLKEKFEEELSEIPGVLIEPKKFSLAVHYRLVEEENLPQIQELVEEVVSSNRELRLMKGKKVFEILPNINWDKGRAVRWLLQAFGLSWESSSVIYIGDDTTDEDAFRIIRTRGTGILVADQVRCSAADFWIKSPQDIKGLFELILSYHSPI